MTYDYLTINYAAVAGILFLLIFLHANASLDIHIKKIFYLLIFIECIEMITYSMELWTTTFEQLSSMRLWLSAIGYSIRPIIFCLILRLATRNTAEQSFPKMFYVPAVVNVIAAFSVFFTDAVYSYTMDNQFHRGPLGYFTHIVTLVYLIILVVVVTKHHVGRSKLEVLIIFAVSLLIIVSMVIEAIYKIRTVGRTSIVMVTIFYYMFFQTQVYKNSLSEEQNIRMALEEANRIDGLTGLLNKNTFSESVREMLLPHKAVNYSSIAFVFIDLDHLKEINDTFGHAKGDEAIIDAANVLKSIFRRNDLIGRFGGDEFYVMLPGIPKHRLQMCLNEAQDKLRKNYTVGAITVAVTASIGAVYSENTEHLTYEKMMEFADSAVYEAKAAGRDCHILKKL